MKTIGRKKLDHTPPLSIDPLQAQFFITICAAERGGKSLLAITERLLQSVRFYEDAGKWHAHIF